MRLSPKTFDILVSVPMSFAIVHDLCKWHKGKSWIYFAIVIARIVTILLVKKIKIKIKNCHNPGKTVTTSALFGI